jgi:hypothetical protein
LKELAHQGKAVCSAAARPTPKEKEKPELTDNTSKAILEQATMWVAPLSAAE